MITVNFEKTETSGWYLALLNEITDIVIKSKEYPTADKDVMMNDSVFDALLLIVHNICMNNTWLNEAIIEMRAEEDFRLICENLERAYLSTNAPSPEDDDFRKIFTANEFRIILDSNNKNPEDFLKDNSLKTVKTYQEVFSKLYHFSYTLLESGWTESFINYLHKVCDLVLMNHLDVH